MTLQFEFMQIQPTHQQKVRSEAPHRVATTHAAQLATFVESLARPSAAFRLARWTAHTPPASVSPARGDIPAATVSRGAADGRTIGSGLR